jgi:exodeoxyribonuclease-3
VRIATWNINSVRLRLGLIEQFTKQENPDVLCLQETKAMNDVFPQKALAEMGYLHQHFNGMKSYNGVAILSRLPFVEHGIKNWANQEDCRHIYVTLKNGTEIHCVYVPAGGDIPNPDENPKFAHKLQFLDEMASWWKEQAKHPAPKIVLGDMNIAPLEHDVWSHKQLLDVVSHTPIEVEKLQKMQAAHDFIDAVRHFVPEDEKLYSWWSYRARDWDASDKGRRLDHIWITKDLKKKLKSAETLRTARGWQPKPSDHVPIIIQMTDDK